jgi:hypothetical protein
LAALKRRTVLLKGQTQRWGVPTIASRKRKINIFREENAGFKAMIDLNKRRASRWCLFLHDECGLNFSKAKV